MKTIKHVKIFLILVAILCSAIVTLSAELKRPSREYKVYFENTSNELCVYKLYGRFDGKTVFILGGIQGDEPGGYLSADLYPDLVLDKGNLIIIPRANFHSIILNKRGVNGDMNRRFDHSAPSDIDDQIVEIIKELISESDLFLNLHDGSGFYSDTYMHGNRNPQKFGQSIIADAARLVFGRDTLKLEEMAQEVIERINYRVDIPDHRFHFLNTNTLASDTKYPEQKKSATYYALTTFHIPAFGIESSKDLKDIELKIRYHNYAINEFLKLMGVEPEHPAIFFEPPKLIYLLMSINGAETKIVENNSSLQINSGDILRITHIESNYNRGITCDVIGAGSEQDFQKPITVLRPTSIIVRRDHQVIGEVRVETVGQAADSITYLIEVNGSRKKISSDQTLFVQRGDKIKIIDVLVPGVTSSEIKVNLKGYAPRNAFNDGEDRNSLIDIRKMNWNKYSVDGKGKKYPIIVTRDDRELTHAYIYILD
ncbi:MAG: M14/M99 family metallopeptidase [Candidatus Neomarinimicrobiota bacterium]